MYLYVAEYPGLYMYMSVTNVYIRVVYFTYIYHACDVFYSTFIPCVADPSWSFSLRALYSASGLHHSM